MALRNLRGFHSSKLNTIRQISFATTTTSHLLINHEVGLLKPLFVTWRYSGFPEKWPFSAGSDFPRNGILSNLPWHPRGNLPKMRLFRNFVLSDDDICQC